MTWFPVLPGWGVLAGALAILWWRQTRTRNATSVDLAWSMGLGLLAIWYAVWPGHTVAPVGVPGLVAVLGTGWALRLAWHLWADRVRGRSDEDGRYAAMRAHWGPRANVGFFWVYQGQALVATLFSLPMLAAMRTARFDGWVVAGIIVWIVAVAGETSADRQLAAFRADPANRGRTCREGLWRYSRHPNYFFEWLHWWTYVLIGHGVLLTWLGPALMLLFLFRITGIPYTEAQAVKSRGDDYRRYQRETSKFFPWFPAPEAGRKARDG